jgi:hypothetical protein
MNLRVLLLMAVVLVLAIPVFAATDSPVQVRYAANLAAGDSVINITNTGASGGNICVNVYTFSPDEQLIACCSCVVTPNGLVSLSAQQDLISNTLTPRVPGSITVKLVSTNTGACNASALGTLASGLAAWGSTIHAAQPGPGWSMVETAFTNATPGAADLARTQALCGFIQSNGSDYGICRSCRFGALGGAAKQ